MYQKPIIMYKGKLKQFAGSPVGSSFNHDLMSGSGYDYDLDLDYDIGDYENYD